MTTLIVYVTGLGGHPRDSAPLRERLVTEAGHQTDVIRVHPVPLRWYSRGSMSSRGAALAAQIHSWDQRDNPDKIVLIGFSMGGLLVRFAYLFHAGAFRSEPRRDWVDKVDRIVLLGTPNSGFQRGRLPLPMRLGLTLARFVTSLTVFDVEAGSPFITDLRIRWVRYFRDAQRAGPPVVQLLGAQDGLVRREDSLDIEAMPLARHETVPNSTHTELTRVTDTSFGEERYHFLRSAILEPIEPTDPPGQPAPNDRRPVVFILHGIRAGKRGWVKGLKEILESRTERPVAITPSYGYFSALSFALRYRRVSNLRWFLDRYSQELVRRPDTTFCFAGHSNGTYILGSALAAVPSLAFNNVYLAGSVLPRRYDWASRFSGQQLTALRNDCASRDIPVLWLCSALKSLRQTDVGTAGVDGFDDLDERAVEYSYLEGGHAAALDDGRLPAIASFVMTGTSSAPGGLVPSPSRAFAFVGRLLQVVTLLAFVAGAYVVGRWIASGPVVAHALVTAGVAFVAWILLRAA